MTRREARDRLVTDRCIRLIPAREMRAIIECALARCGERRAIATILALADEHCVRRDVVAAAFGYLPDFFFPGRFIDVFNQNDTALFNTTDNAVTAAFCLARCVGGKWIASRLGVQK